MKRKTTGMLGEKLAADFLTCQGYAIIETNFRCKEGEVDIIAKEGEFLVFVEVRAKHNSNFGDSGGINYPQEKRAFEERCGPLSGNPR
jgi:putative endonuclease